MGAWFPRPARLAITPIPPLAVASPTTTAAVTAPPPLVVTLTPSAIECVTGDRVALMMKLLSPARRPVQVTQDLKSFWEKGYHEVKKELKGRYPKHYWPEDPWAALPTRRVRPRS